jgi:hypothetical protein
VRGIAKRFGVNPGTMQRISRLFAESVGAGMEAAMTTGRDAAAICARAKLAVVTAGIRLHRVAYAMPGHNTAQNALIANMRDAPRNIQHSLGHGAG